jgi:hypothetical protein
MKHRGIKLRLFAATAAVGALALAAVAWATPTEIPLSDSYELELGSVGDTVFDVSQPPDDYNDDCALGDLGGDEDADLGFSPANDGTSADGDSDTFDGGLVLAVGDAIFQDADRNGDLVGEQLTVGPDAVGGLRVKRVETALPGSPTLRSLIKLKNKSKRQAKKRTIVWDSDLGADGDEVVAASSTGDLALSNADRWHIFDEDPGSDPLGTLVLYGKGKGVKKATVVDGISAADANGCVRFNLRVRIPAKSSRYLLFFTEMHDSDALGLAASDAAKFNTKKPGGGVLAGLKKSVKKKVLNWDLVKEKKGKK